MQKTFPKDFAIPVALALGNLNADDLAWLEDVSELPLGSLAFTGWLARLVSAEGRRRNGEQIEFPIPDWTGLGDSSAADVLQAAMGMLLTIQNDRQFDAVKYIVQLAVGESITRLRVRGVLAAN